MSRAIGLGTGSFMGARVAGQITYIQAHVKNGKNINQRCIIPVYINSNKGTNRDGTPGRSDQFRLVAWGKLADICAKSLPKGKALDCVYSPHSYEGRIYDAQGNMRVDNTGQPITVERVGFTIEKIVFGEESLKKIDQEIQEGRRPVNWNVSNHPDVALWTNILQTRQNAQFQGGNVFGFARVVVPSGPDIVLTTGQPVQAQAQAQTFQPQGNAMATLPVAPATVDPAQLAQLVQQVLQGQIPPATVPNQQGYNTAPITPTVQNASHYPPNQQPAAAF